MLDLFGLVFFYLNVGVWGVLSQRGMMLLMQISFIMEVTSLLNIPGYYDRIVHLKLMGFSRATRQPMLPSSASCLFCSNVRTSAKILLNTSQ